MREWRQERWYERKRKTNGMQFGETLDTSFFNIFLIISVETNISKWAESFTHKSQSCYTCWLATISAPLLLWSLLVSLATKDFLQIRRFWFRLHVSRPDSLIDANPNPKPREMAAQIIYKVATLTYRLPHPIIEQYYHFRWLFVIHQH